MHWLITFLTAHWRDACEITFFSYLFYFVGLWLKKDHAHNLLFSFYSLVLLYTGSYILNLSTIFYLLSCIWPILGTLFIIMHQVTLQRNFVALKHATTINTHDTSCSSWLEIVTAASLHLLNRNSPIFCIIERSDSAKELIQTSLVINAPITKELLHFMYTHNFTDNNLMTWINSNGHVQALNCTWKTDIEHTSKNDRQSIYTAWITSTLMHTHYTDIIAFYGDPSSRTFTVVINNNVLPNITGSQLYTLLLKLLRTNQNLLHTHYSQSINIKNKENNIKKQEHAHDNQHTKNTYHQRNA